MKIALPTGQQTIELQHQHLGITTGIFNSLPVFVQTAARTIQLQAGRNLFYLNFRICPTATVSLPRSRFGHSCHARLTTSHPKRWSRNQKLILFCPAVSLCLVCCPFIPLNFEKLPRNLQDIFVSWAPPWAFFQERAANKRSFHQLEMLSSRLQCIPQETLIPRQRLKFLS